MIPLPVNDRQDEGEGESGSVWQRMRHTTKCKHMNQKGGEWLTIRTILDFEFSPDSPEDGVFAVLQVFERNQKPDAEVTIQDLSGVIIQRDE